MGRAGDHGANGRIVLARPAGGLGGFGLTELFFETSEPSNADVPIADALARMPEGTYTFTGKMVRARIPEGKYTFTGDMVGATENSSLTAT